MTKIGWSPYYRHCDGCKRSYTGRTYHIGKDRVCEWCGDAHRRFMDDLVIAFGRVIFKKVRNKAKGQTASKGVCHDNGV